MTESYKITKKIETHGLEKLKNLTELLTKQVGQVEETINKINDLEVSFSLKD